MTKEKAKTDEDGILVVTTNKNAFRNYEIVDTLEAGIVLLGSEVKSIRAGEINIKDAYVRIHNGEAFLMNCHITPYKYSRIDEINPLRERKLLLHAQELERLEARISQKGLTVVPTKMYFRRGRCKLELGVGKGKKLHDRREDLKEREARREIERAFRGKR